MRLRQWYQLMGGKDLYGVPAQIPAADRARWLAELSEVLNEAHEVMLHTDFSEQQRAAANELYLRIEAARLEVQSLRLSRSLNPRPEPVPEWMQSAPWQPGRLRSV